MGGKLEKPEDIVLKLRQAEVLQGQGKPFSMECPIRWSMLNVNA